jgi:hypothetical protein
MNKARRIEHAYTTPLLFPWLEYSASTRYSQYILPGSNKSDHMVQLCSVYWSRSTCTTVSMTVAAIM